jgi:hypothetical protein
VANAFQLTVKTEAAWRYAVRAGFKSRIAIATRLDAITEAVAAGHTLDEIREEIIDMRGWAWSGPLDEWAWMDHRLDELAAYLTTPEESRTLRELAADLEADILAHHGERV